MKKFWLAACVVVFAGWSAVNAAPQPSPLASSADSTGVRTMTELPQLPARVPQQSLSRADAILYPSVLPVPFIHVMEMLVGRIAGVWVSGGPLFYQVRIRGALGPPLIVLDEMPFPFDNDAEFNHLLLSIPPMDVARIEVIKNPAEAAIYGRNASNGVILIYTKQGTEEE